MRGAGRLGEFLPIQNEAWGRIEKPKSAKEESIMRNVKQAIGYSLIGRRTRLVSFFLVLGFVGIILPESGANRLTRIPVVTAAAPQKTSANDLWQDIDEGSIRNATQRQIIPSRYRTIRLNKEALRLIIENAPLEFTSGARTSPAEIALPVPDGSYARFSIVESPIMEPGLAKAFPEIRTFRGQGIDDPTATMRFDWTPEGLHAIVLSASGTVYIDPYAKGNTDDYISYNKQDHQSDKPFQCLVSEEAGANKAGAQSSPTNIINGTVLRTYRLAVAATGEYTAQVGGTVPSALSAITTNINRVNAIYERDLSVRFVLVNGESNIIFTDAAMDPYTNSDPNAMLGQNQEALDLRIMDGNYDIGHVFGTGGFGLGQFNVVCSQGAKAQGVSAHFTPEDRFAVEMVSHEIGHQFGARHTFNGSLGGCGLINGSNPRDSSSSHEPGAGSTIMAYVYSCPGNGSLPNQNLQDHKDDYFHIKNLEQMLGFINGGGGCPPPTATGNSPPTVDAGPSYTIPKATPFNLVATGSDPNGDSITYTWEEYDLGPASPPDTDADGLARPIFRSYPGTVSPSRAFPALKYILDSANVPPINLFPLTSSQQYLTAEALAVITRTMTFQVTARDNHAGGGGVSSDSTQLNVTASAGPFYVTQPNTAMIWTPGSQATVTWSVANTNIAPVNCANVKITLSTDGGTTFPIVLTASTPNDGSQTVTVPSVVSIEARVRVEAVGNIFFDISDTNFIIPASGCSYFVTPSTRHVGPSQSSKTVSVTVSSGCFWKAKSNAPWIVINSGNSGNDNGNGTVSYTILQNVNGATRVGTISVAGQTQTITQDTSATCSFSISPSNDSFAPNGGTGRVDITTSTTCNWTALSNDSWIVIISGSAGVGNAPVLYSVMPNAASSRTGTLTVAGFTFTVTQLAAGSVNLALNKPATQSSTDFGGTADRAVDGNTDGVFTHGSVTSTAYEYRAWWQVDLGTASTVQTIKVYNRTECCIERLDNSYVFVSQQPFGTRTLDEILNDATVFHYYIGTAPALTTITVNQSGRYVRVQLAGTNFLSLVELEVWGIPTAPPPANLALNRPATQSSTEFGGTADRAVDGNTSGVFTNNSITSTAFEYRAWWQVDLGAVSTIQTIKIYNRTECCGDRLNNSYVFVSQQPFGTRTLDEILNDATVFHYYIGTAPALTTITVNQSGRYVRVQLAGTNYLSLAEVEVWGIPTTPPPANLALNKPATQSTTEFGGTADRAVDGNTSGVFTDGSITSTTFEYRAWWQVDLGAASTIQTIKIYNRTECCGDRLNNSYVFLSQQPFGTRTLDQLLADPSVFKYHIVVAPALLTVTVNQPGRYVRVQLENTNYLSLAEVQVWGN